MELFQQGCEVLTVIYNEKKKKQNFLWYGLIATELCECLVYKIF